MCYRAMCEAIQPDAADKFGDQRFRLLFIAARALELLELDDRKLQAALSTIRHGGRDDR